MNPYDKAHELAKSIRSWDAYDKASKAKAAIEADSSALQMTKDYLRRQFELQAKQMRGETLTPDELENFQKLSDVVQLNRDVRAYLEADRALQVLLMDIQNILSEVMDDVSVLSIQQIFEEMGRIE